MINQFNLYLTDFTMCITCNELAIGTGLEAAGQTRADIKLLILKCHEQRVQSFKFKIEITNKGFI